MSFRAILTINVGSSGVKFAVYDVAAGLALVFDSVIDQPVADHADTVDEIMAVVASRAAGARLVGVGHRVVHGGPTHSNPLEVSTTTLEDLETLSVFDPEHLPQELAMIRAMMRRFTHVPQVACFDTQFHHDLPRVARILPIPRRYEAHGVRRYGFHGLSYSFLIDELRRLDGEQSARGRVVCAHLGNGASLAAVRNGHSVDTTMGFTPSGGIPMSTRSGDLDPGLISYLARTGNIDPDAMTRMLNFESGLLGISETTSDMRELEAHAASDRRADDAVSIFCYQIKKYIGAYAAALGGLDTIVFAGGIGENAPKIRAKICEGLEFLGVCLDHERNACNAPLISRHIGPVAVRVIRTNEQIVIARGVLGVLDAEAARGHHAPTDT